MGHFAASGVSVPVSEPGLLSPTGADFDPSAAAAAVMGQTGATPATGTCSLLLTYRVGQFIHVGTERNSSRSRTRSISMKLELEWIGSLVCLTLGVTQDYFLPDF